LGGAEPGEAGGAIAQRYEFGVSEQAAISGEKSAQDHGGIRVGERHQFVGVTHREEFEQGGVQHAENRGVYADAEREGENGNQSSGWTLGEYAQAEANVLDHSL
jgi:hypothetical protein